MPPEEDAPLRGRSPSRDLRPSPVVVTYAGLADFSVALAKVIGAVGS